MRKRVVKIRNRKERFMNVIPIEERIIEYRDEIRIPEPKEARVAETVRDSKKAFYESGQLLTASYAEFLFRQASYIRKRWWLLQLLTLLVLWGILYTSGSGYFAQRGMGVLSSVFATLLIPELWKNRSTGSVEIEGASFYSLRQVYAARMLCFAMADAVFLSAFCLLVSVTVRITAMEMIVQFFLPFAVTCCICFGMLCSRRFGSEYTAAAFSMLWIAVWVLVMLDERVYNAVTGPVWVSLLCAACFFMAAAICRLLHNGDNYQEVNPQWN